MSLIIFLVIGLIALGLCCPGWGGAWTPGAGKAYLKLASNHFSSNANYNGDGDLIDPFADIEGSFSKFTDDHLSFYGEVGLTDRLALTGSLAYKEIKQRTKTAFFDVAVENNGWADVELGLTYQSTTGKHVFSVAGLAKLPYLYDEDEFFPLGNGQEDFEGRLLYGTSLNRWFYAGLEAGYRFRLDEPSDEIRFQGELGGSLARVYARTKYRGIRSQGDLETGNSLNPILNPSFDLDEWELTAGVRVLKNWYVEATWTDTVAGKNVAGGELVQVAVVLQL